MHHRRIVSSLSTLSFVFTTGAIATGCFGGRTDLLLSSGSSGSTGVIDTPDASAPPLDASAPTDAAPPLPRVAPQKVDLLFAIDNSESMADKQAYLEQQIPELLGRLTTPRCLDGSGTSVGTSTDDGVCPSGSTVEFPPVHDMHIGIVTSSLGPRLGDLCVDPTLTIDGFTHATNNDDQGHLVTRGANPLVVADAAAGFLSWLPAVPANAAAISSGATGLSDVTTLNADFADMVEGVGQWGCGIESQLESWYRFLVQPDPYAAMALTPGPNAGQKLAQWVGVDTTILAQRRAFLRPDSLVVVLVLSDENDSEIDVRSIGGQGWLFMDSAFQPPHGTSECSVDPSDPACISCDADDTSASDPACTANGGFYSSPNDWGFDPNLRHAHMKAKYGLDAQFPIGRYVTGLTSAHVPDRTGEYPAGALDYVGTADCVSPLFAASLPDPTTLSGTVTTNETVGDANALCNLTRGSRLPTDVFFAFIGGVPGDLLHYDPTSAANSTLSASDWVKILGSAPDALDYAGIDPRMIESAAPRGVASDWVTNQGPHLDFNVDLEYACTFALAAPRDCTQTDNVVSCDCSSVPGSLTSNELPPVCDPNDPTRQIAGRAYPGIRQLDLVRQLGAQGIASSICPTDSVDNATQSDPLFGYRPATDELVRHLKTALVAAH